MKKHATEMLGHKLAKTYHLVFDGECAGRIDTCYGQTYAACTATVRIWAGPWAGEVETYRAGGGGYCRESHAVSWALWNSTANKEILPCAGGGMTTLQKVAQDAGYLWCGS